jgi:3-oxoacyl-[acyl-carrier-protein] synthase-3
MTKRKVIINGVGSCIPGRVVKNEDFLDAEFYQENGEAFTADNGEIIHKFEKITGIRERRYAEDNQKASDLAGLAAQRALNNSTISGEDLDYIIVAHNFGDITHGSNRIDMMPSLAARVKHILGIKNPATSCYDVIFGCPGWVQGAIQAYQMIAMGDADNVMVIGAETLSRIVDVHDRDSMIFSDGAAATIFHGTTEEVDGGILAQASRTDADVELDYLAMGPSFHPEKRNGQKYIKMKGRKIYEYALINVASAIKLAMDKAGVGLSDLSKILIHQANEKMDEAILKKLFKICKEEKPMEELMPMTIQTLGNSSVATIPTMLDLILEKKLEKHLINSGDILVFASVGAGMHINAIVYKVP